MNYILQRLTSVNNFNSFLYLTKNQNYEIVIRYFYQTKNVWLKSVLKKSKLNADFLENYSNDEKEKILNAINKLNLEQLNGYSISKGRLKNLESWKTKNGELQSLEQIYEVENFSTKIVKKFYDSIIKSNNNKDLRNQIDYDKTSDALKRANNLSIPSITNRMRSGCKSCVSLQITATNIAYTRFHLDLIKKFIEIDRWDCIEIENKKLHVNDLINLCLKYDELIPEADCYVIENPQLIQTSQLSGNIEQIKVNIQKSQLIGILSFALLKRNLFILNNNSNDINNVEGKTKDDDLIRKTELMPNVFYLKRFLASKLFNTFVGKEIISSEDTILNLMKLSIPNCNVKEIMSHDSENENSKEEEIQEKADHLMIPIELKDHYMDVDKYKKEFLGQSLLVGLAFIKLCLLQCRKSLEIIGIKN